MTQHMRFSVIPGWCATDPRLTGRDLQVLCVLGRHIDREGWCTRSQVKIAAELGCARGTVQNSLKRLGEIGVVEVRENETADGRDCAHDYRVLFDGPAPKAWFAGENEGAKPAEYAPDDAEKATPPPANILAPLPTHGLAPPANSELAPYKNDPLRTEEERERAGARDGQEPPTGEGPAGMVRGAGREAFKAAHRDWPTFTTDSSPEAEKAWFALSAEERMAAAANAARYGAASRADGRKLVCSFAVYLREKRWEKLPPPAPVEAAQRVLAPFGPEWAALRLLRLAAGPGPLPKPSAFLAGLIAAGGEAGERERLAHQARYGFPAVAAMDARAAEGRGVALPEGWANRVAQAAAPERMRPVKAGTETERQWLATLERRGWPPPPAAPGMAVSFWPVDGEAGLAEIERILAEGEGKWAS